MCKLLAFSNMEQAFYRKYRPQNLDEMIGQDEAVALISSQISDDKIGHAYLFSGPKGVGKTSLARTIDAEFIRFIAGTHHISEAFQRAGVSDTEVEGWIIYLPEIQENNSLDNGISPSVEYKDNFETTALGILESLKLTPSHSSLELNLENADKLGMDINDLDFDNLEDALIGFVLSSEFHT